MYTTTAEWIQRELIFFKLQDLDDELPPAKAK